jgi:glycosyltransferase involved in cell wall biosynthesis
MLPPPLKLALISSPPDWSGAEQVLWSLGAGLVERGHSVFWVCNESSPLYMRVRNYGLDCFALPCTPNPSSLLQLRHACSTRGIEIVHSNDSKAFTWGSVALLGKLNIKRVRVKHTVSPIRSAVHYNWMLDRLVCVSEAVRDVCIQGGIASQKCSVVHGGVEPPKLEQSLERLWACERLAIQHQTPLYAAVGSLIPSKGYHRLIEAAHHLRWHMPDFCIAICGEGKSRQDLEQLIRKYSLQQHVRLLGYQDEPERWISAADAFVHPSLHEGLSLVAIQAQMVGTPVVAMEVGGLREVLRSPESGAPLGWIYEGDDPGTLASLMTTAIQNTPERNSIIREAKRSAWTRFHVRNMTDGFEDLYFKLLFSRQKQPSPALNSQEVLKNAG